VKGGICLISSLSVKYGHDLLSEEEDLFPYVFALSWFTDSVQQMRKTTKNLPYGLLFHYY